MTSGETSEDEKDDEWEPVTYSFYVGHDKKDLGEWIEYQIDDDTGEFYGIAHLFEEALRNLREDMKDEIQ